MKDVSIAPACRAFDFGETGYRYSPKQDEENEQMATEWLWSHNHERPNMENGEITPAQKLKMAANILQAPPPQ